MAVIPYSRVVNVTVTRADNFPARRGFGTPLFLQSDTAAGEVDASHRTKVYSSMDEIAADWTASDEAYKAAEAAFSQKPSPLQIKIGYYDASTAMTAQDLKDELDLIQAADPNWYFLCVESALRDDTALVPAIAQWAESKVHIAIVESNDVTMKNPANNTNVAALLKATEYERTSIFYHETVSEYPAMALAAKLSTFVLDNDESAYTPAFKKLSGITRSNISSADLQAVTGFVPALGQDKTQGHLATVYVDIGSQNHVQFGSVMKLNTFIDEIHFGDWLKARIEEEIFGILLNNPRVPFDKRGMTMLAQGAEVILNRAERSGAIAHDIDDETGEFSPPYRITIPNALSVPASQRKARIAPPIRVAFRYAGAVHYAQVDVTVNS
jgi:hypothetical protein